MAIIYDATAGFIDTDLCKHDYTYNGPNGQMDSDTVTTPDGATKFKKTFTFTAMGLSSESAWIKQ
ncbi:hypothetical protein [Burkholderia ubonensis]|uniref:Uncharacterized protein n=1 Tax=Burkholderia ubonensis TaxID=101571 RepID=A0ABD4DZA6_9BURK|nr:hypothetical protein [Burkholderia ubonensis]KVN83448.1 hypothetical protein WJ68_16170 [Burkholderia ubonensis]